MKKNICLNCLLFIVITGCVPKIDFSKYVPSNVNNFATGFVNEVHKGNIDSCLKLVMPEMNTEEGRNLLTNAFSKIQNYSIDSFSIVNARKSTLMGSNGFTDYNIEYEYPSGSKYLYFAFGVRDEKGKLTVTGFNGALKDGSLSKDYEFTLKGKGFMHFIFLIFVILIPLFIIVTVIFAAKTKLNRKWLWIIGILLGFVTFSINWSTGDIGFKPFNFNLLGAGILKSGNIAPWILSFSIPVVAIIFWVKRFTGMRAVKTISQTDGSISEEKSNLSAQEPTIEQTSSEEPQG